MDATVRGLRAADAVDWTTDEAWAARGTRDGQAAADRGIRSEEQPDEGAYAICAMSSRGWVTQ
ncbi:MAG: hypothetical protein M0Z54_03395 [Thermaerobacter sp.]|nr:hypothetical protein [Thermaerobacter sp.]